jgi:hypothetical protein
MPWFPDFASAVELARQQTRTAGLAFHDAGGVFHHAGTAGRAAGPAPDHQSYGSFISFSGPGRQRVVRSGDHHAPSGPVTT